MTLADKLNLLLTRKRWTAEYLAMRAEIDASYMSRLLSGDRTKPSPGVLDRLAFLLDVAPAYLGGMLNAGEQCDRDGSPLAKDGRRWWCDVCGRHVIPLGYGRGGIDALVRDEREYQNSITQPGGGSRSSKRKRERKKGGMKFTDGPNPGRRDAFGNMPARGS